MDDSLCGISLSFCTVQVSPSGSGHDVKNRVWGRVYAAEVHACASQPSVCHAQRPLWRVFMGAEKY